jgi:hypothetical protein
MQAISAYTLNADSNNMPAQNDHSLWFTLRHHYRNVLSFELFSIRSNNPILRAAYLLPVHRNYCCSAKVMGR